MSGELLALTKRAGPTAPAFWRPDGLARRYRLAVGDNRGPVNYRLASLFCAPYLWKYDRSNVIRQFATLQKDGYHGYRAVHTLGGVSWADRSLEPTRDAVQSTIEMIRFAHAEFGLLAMITLIGDVVDGIENADKREQFVRWYANAVQGSERTILCAEIGNELVNGGKVALSEVRHLGRLLKAMAPDLLVALTAPAMWDLWGTHRALYEGSDVDIATIHYERDNRGDGGEWEYVYKPEEATTDEVRAWWDRPTFDSEPRGVGSSVTSDNDVLRLVMACGISWLAGNACHVHHDATGLRLGGVWDRGRLPANLAESPTWPACAAGFRALERFIPPGIQNWKRHRGHWSSNPINFIPYRKALPDGRLDNGPFDDGTVFKVLTAEGDRQLLAGVLRLREPQSKDSDGKPLAFTIKAERSRRPMRLEVIDPLTAEVVASGENELQLEPYRHRPDGDGLFVRGTW